MADPIFLTFYISFALEVIVFFSNKIGKFISSKFLTIPPEIRAEQFHIYSNEQFIAVHTARAVAVYDLNNDVWRSTLFATDYRILTIKLLDTHFVMHRRTIGGQEEYSVFSLVQTDVPKCVATFDGRIVLLDNYSFALPPTIQLGGTIAYRRVTLGDTLSTELEPGFVTCEFLPSIQLNYNREYCALSSLDGTNVMYCDISRCIQFTNMIAAPAEYDLSTLLLEIDDPVLCSTAVPANYRIWSRIL